MPTDSKARTYYSLTISSYSLWQTWPQFPCLGPIGHFSPAGKSLKTFYICKGRRFLFASYPLCLTLRMLIGVGQSTREWFKIVGVE